MRVSYALVCDDKDEYIEIAWDFGQAFVGSKRKPLIINQVTRVAIYVHPYTNDLRITRTDVRAAIDASDYTSTSSRSVKWTEIYDHGFKATAHALKPYADNGLSVRGAIQLAKDLRGLVLTLAGFQDLEPDVSRSMLDTYGIEEW